MLPGSNGRAPTRSHRRITGASVSAALLVLTCAALPFARGGVDWRLELAATLAGLAALALATDRETSIPASGVLLAVVACAVLLQLVPLPPWAIRLVSPEADRVFDSALRPVGLYPGPRPLSLDPPATARQLAKVLGYLSAFLAAALLAARRPRRELLLAAVALTGTALASVGFVAAAFGQAPLLEPRLTFVNPNHLAAFLDLAAFVSLGFAVRARRRTRALWLIAFAVTAAGIFVSLSRGGIAAFFVGAGAFAGLLVLRRRREDPAVRLAPIAALAAAVAGAVALGAYLALDPLLGEARTLGRVADESKVHMWPVAARLVRDFWATGIGGGSFQTAFPAYKIDPLGVTFTHVENEWLQALIDLGIPFGLLLVAAIGWTWLRAARSTTVSRPEIGALAGAAALLAHDLVDFSLEAAGVGVAFAVVLGVLSRFVAPRPVRRGLLLGLTAAAAATACVAGAVHAAHPTDPPAVAGARTADEAVALATAALRWHPADFVLPTTAGALLATEGRCAEALPWLVRAMGRDPTAPQPHRFVARCLANRHDVRAKREYRLALLFGDGFAFDEVLRTYPSVGDLLEVVPDLPDALLFLGRALLPNRPEDAERVLRRAWEEYGEADALFVWVHALLASGKPEDAAAAARALQRIRPADTDGYVLAATALRKLGRPAEARGELEAGVARIPGAAPLLGPLVDEALSARRYAEALRLAREISAPGSREASSKQLLVANVLLASGRVSEALAAARSARDASPDDPAVQLALSDMSASAGRYEEAIAAVEAAAALPGAAPGQYDARLASLRAARAKQLDDRTRLEVLKVP